MMQDEIHIVTGAFGYSGKYIARRLLDAGRRVRTLTGSPHRANPFDGLIETLPFNFDNPRLLRESLAGAKVLHNTYWVRFNYSTFSHAAAVENTMKLFQAAGEAGIERIVHVSILNPSENSGLEYFRGKALLEKALIESGISYAILRPAVLFGKEDVLINNIAWLLRKFPVFAIPGDGKYRIQPIHVDDLAKLAVEQGDARTDAIIDAVGPETFTYRELVQEIASAIGLSRFLVSLPPSLVWLASLCIGLLVHDVLLTREELKGLIDNLLFADAPPVGEVRLSDWLRDNAEALGRRYANEVRRRENLRQSYDAL